MDVALTMDEAFTKYALTGDDAFETIDIYCRRGLQDYEIPYFDRVYRHFILWPSIRDNTVPLKVPIPRQYGETSEACYFRVKPFLDAVKQAMLQTDDVPVWIESERHYT